MRIEDLKQCSREELEAVVRDSDALLFAARTELVSRGTVEATVEPKTWQQHAKKAAVEALVRQTKRNPYVLGFAIVVLFATVGQKLMELVQ